ncbi:MAG: hypothetical protein VR68_08520 [Peptococcaceae bacterium BRH_c4a]|nr:MAG: hypothetical protein VR68_08520 [Peptococcaceae bacterium BRH_c4a]
MDINIRWCKGCNLCVTICPKGILSLDELGKITVDKPEECIGCGLCEGTCPDFAIKVVKDA